MCENSILNAVTAAVVRAARESLGEKLNRVILYGSYARGDCDGDSDIDIMVLADIPHEDCWREYLNISKRIQGLGLENDVLISINVTDCEMFEKFQTVLPYYKTVLREGVDLSA
jgi:predicted nucleotidyltransferase